MKRASRLYVYQLSYHPHLIITKGKIIHELEYQGDDSNVYIAKELKFDVTSIFLIVIVLCVGYYLDGVKV